MDCIFYSLVAQGFHGIPQRLLRFCTPYGVISHDRLGAAHLPYGRIAVHGLRATKGRTMNSRFSLCLVLVTLLLCSAGAWAQCSAPAFEQKSIAALKQQADSGVAAAQCGLGVLYETGDAAGFGVPQDYGQAAIWSHKAAEQGNATAQFELGILYVRGEGVPQDYTQAVAWYRKAADQGALAAQKAMAAAYESGRGVPQDYAQAAIWWRKAAEQGDARAEWFLARAFGSGQGVPQDYAQAAIWFRKAAEQGIANAQYFLGRQYESGLGVPQDYAEAYFWLDLAAVGTLDDPFAKNATKSRDEAASMLIPADLSREQERARKWFEDHPPKPQ
jgi:hypothetical protein